MPMPVAHVQLANGQIVEVPPALIKRQKQHFTTLEGTGTCSLPCPGLLSCCTAHSTTSYG